MASMQKLILIGYLGKDPEIRYTPSGAQITTFSIATTETWKDKNTQEKKERTEWHTIEAWGKLAELTGQYLHKGAQVYCEGKLRTDEWEQDGEKKRWTKVRLDNVTFLQTDRDQQGKAQASPPSGNTSAPVTTDADFNEDIPF